MKIVIVDSDSLFRIGLRSVLSTMRDISHIAEAGTFGDGLAAVFTEQPDIVLLELALPDADGTAAVREIRQRSPRIRVIMISGHDQINDVLAALNAGASGYLMKREHGEGVLAAVGVVARGERYLSPPLAALVAAHERRRRRATDALAILSKREREVFWLAAQCLVSREIAERLCISRKTADTHLHRIHLKLTLRGPAELVRLAVGIESSARRDEGPPRLSPPPTAPPSPRDDLTEMDRLDIRAAGPVSDAALGDVPSDRNGLVGSAFAGSEGERA